VFIKVRQPGGWNISKKAYSISLGGREELIYETQAEANEKSNEIRCAINYLVNSGIKVEATTEIKEIC
jgi:uncharacterized OsmC-like protein